MKTQEKKVFKSVLFPLSEKELVKKGELVAALDSQHSDTAREFEAVKKNYQARLRDLSAKRAVEIEAIREKKESREVDCVEVHNYEKKTVTTLVAKKKVEERTMNAGEYQVFMDLQAGEKKKEQAKKDADAKKAADEASKAQAKGSPDAKTKAQAAMKLAGGGNKKAPTRKATPPTKKEKDEYHKAKDTARLMTSETSTLNQ